MGIRFRKGNKPDKTLDPMEELGLEDLSPFLEEAPYEEVDSVDSQDTEFDGPEAKRDESTGHYETSHVYNQEVEESQPEGLDYREDEPEESTELSNENSDFQDLEQEDLQMEDPDYQADESEESIEISNEDSGFQDPGYEESQPEGLDYQEDEPELVSTFNAASYDFSPESAESSFAQHGVENLAENAGASLSSASTAKNKLIFISNMIRGRGFRRPKLPTNQRIVTLTTEKDSFRLVVFKGRRVVAWGSTSLVENQPVAPPSEQSDLADDEMFQSEVIIETPLERLLNDLAITRVNRVWRTLDKVGIRRGRTVIDLSLYTTLMRYLQIPRVRGRYLEPVVVSEVLDSLPFSKEEVDISWKTARSGDTNSVFAVALPKNRLDAQVNTIKEAGLVPSAAYSKAAALALASGTPNGVVVHLEQNEAALVLVQEGEAKTVHQVEFNDSESTVEARTNSISRAIEQVASYFQPEHPQQVTYPLPVILTGQCDESCPVAAKLRRVLRRQVLSIQPSIRCPEDFPMEEYAINVGLFLSDQVGNPYSPAAALGNSSSLNLLPARHLPQPIPVFQAAVFVTLFLLVVHPYNVVGRVDAKILENETIAKELRVLKAEERAFDIVYAGYQKNETGIEESRAQITALESQVKYLSADLSRLLSELGTITGPAMPPGVILSGVAPQGKEYLLAGTASNHAETLQYAVNLRDSDFFKDARVVSVDGIGGANPNSNGIVSFRIKVVPMPAPEPGAGEEIGAAP